MNAKTNGGTPATGFCNELGGLYNHGLTKRELIAAMAMQGILANAWRKYGPTDPECINVAAVAINYADELLKQLDEKIIEKPTVN